MIIEIIITLFIVILIIVARRNKNNNFKGCIESSIILQKHIWKIREKEECEKIRFNAIQISNIDSMSGIEFEKYLQELLNKKFYNVVLTKNTGDFGVDLIATKENAKIAIQAKRYKGKVSRRAISDAVAGMQHYECNQAMVITNNYFTKDAIKFSKTTKCILINRDTLIDWVIESQKL